MDFLYTLFIAPLELVMRAVLDAAYAATGSYGLSLVILSLVVNTAILPIYNRAEAWQEEERAIKRAMEGKEAMIKRAFAGQERFAMLSTLRRQAGYSPWLALRSSTGFFLQIPFFFAAYHLLSHHEGLKGVSFGPIADLGAPDGLLSVAGLAINVLPIVMTIVNVASAQLYAASLTRADKTKLYGLAALFLVLLYASPAALTFYWTLNNVYSVGKNAVEKGWLPAWRARHGRSAAQSLDLTLGAWAARCPGGAKARAAAGALLGVAAGVLIDHVWKVEDQTFYVQPGSLEVFLGLAGASALLLAGAACARKAEGARRAAGLRRAASLLVFAIPLSYVGLLASGVLELWYRSLKLPPTAAILYALLVLALWLVSLLIALTEWAAQRREADEGALKLWRASAFALSVLLAYAFPYAIYGSDPSAVPGGWTGVMPELTIVFAVFLGLQLWVAGASARAGARTGAVVTLFLLVTGLLYAFVFTGRYGVLMEGEFELPAALYARGLWKTDAPIWAACALATWLLWRFATPKRVATVLTVVGCAALIMPVGGLLTEKPAETTPRHAASAEPDYARDLYAFSAKARNLVLVVFDMVTGDEFETLLKEEPELAKGLEGFVWYRDTLSVGSGTGFGLPAATGGNRYSVRNINADNEGLAYQTLYGRAYAQIPNLLGASWSSAVGGWVWEPAAADFKTPPKALVSHERLMEDWYRHFYAAQMGGGAASRRNAAWQLASIALFKMTPYSVRKRVYRDGAWLVPGRRSLNGPKAFAPLKALLTYSRAADVGDTYRYLYFEGTHSGFYFDEAGRPSTTKHTPPAGWRESHPDFEYNHYLALKANMAAFARWLDWLKKSGLYERTRIVVVSDHGGYDSHEMLKVLGPVPQRGTAGPMVANPGLRYPLLMAKDFAAKGAVRVDDALMTNGDALDLLLKGVVDVPAKYRGDVGNPDRVRWYNDTNDWGFEKSHIPSYTYEVRGTMFKKENWRLLNDKFE